jgi:hypothetical protein
MRTAPGLGYSVCLTAAHAAIHAVPKKIMLCTSQLLILPICSGRWLNGSRAPLEMHCWVDTLGRAIM